MIPELFSEDEIRNKVLKGIADAGSARRYAKSIGVNDVEVSFFVNRRRAMSPKLISALKLEKIVIYKETT